ncbi:MAG: peptidoglycan DD-metalloendopeptidase family protein [Bacteroidia bacterium]|nr:peptidoglycan DD-metalloendopeptidase family protein [Bacteroidia bacterium]
MRGNYFRLTILQLLFFLHLFAGEKNTAADTLLTKVKVNANAVHKATESFIQSMNQQQLSSLVDYLFEMDSIPSALVEEINKAVLNYKVVQKCAIENQGVWDEKHIFSDKELLAKLDTSYIINLIDVQDIGFFSPVNGVITSNFGWRDTRNHNGIDIDLNRGDKVYSAFEGVVRFAKYQGGFGNVVVVRHASGLETLYAHLWKIKVKAGDFVNAGDVLGLGGATGHATGTHLHFEVRLKSKPVNPAYVIDFASQKLISNKLQFKSTRLGWAAYPPDTKEYIARKGDTIVEVAKRFGLSAKELARINGLSQWSRLKAGRKICLGV